MRLHRDSGVLYTLILLFNEMPIKVIHDKWYPEKFMNSLILIIMASLGGIVRIPSHSMKCSADYLRFQFLVPIFLDLHRNVTGSPSITQSSISDHSSPP